MGAFIRRAAEHPGVATGERKARGKAPATVWVREIVAVLGVERFGARIKDLAAIMRLWSTRPRGIPANVGIQAVACVSRDLDAGVCRPDDKDTSGYTNSPSFVEELVSPRAQVRPGVVIPANACPGH